VPGNTPGAVPGIYGWAPVVHLTKQSNVCSSDGIGEHCANASSITMNPLVQAGVGSRRHRHKGWPVHIKRYATMG